jgi:triosephosphate isomerase (TIM)
VSKIVVANWKMNGDINKIVQDLDYFLKHPQVNRENTILALPLPFLGLANTKLNTTQDVHLKLASQDASRFNGFGAYTGETSATMLKEMGISYVIIGHSERRNALAEGDDVLISKLTNVAMSEMIPIYCIGEDKEARSLGSYKKVLTSQLETLLKLVEFIEDNNIRLRRLLVAYEPIWSIGTGVIPTLENIIEVNLLIKAFMQKYLPRVKIDTLYGGSVSAANAKDILDCADIDGVLVGGASLIASDFAVICDVASI